MPETLPVQKTRYIFIDIYRGIIVFLMLEGHFVRTLFDINYQQTTAFTIHEFFHGITAPAFLFGSGLTFMVSTRHRWEDYHHFGALLRRRLCKLLLIFLLGLSLHLPYFSLRKIINEGTQKDYLQLFQCDVLNCIAIGLLILHMLLFFFKTEERFYGLVLGLGLVVSLQTPLMWDVNFLEHFSPFIAQLFNNMNGSPFPLFPYVGYLFAGVVVSWEFLLAVEKKNESLFMKKMLVLGGILIMLGLSLDALPVKIYPTYNFWYTSPNYFLIKIGVLLIFTSLVWIISDKVKKNYWILTITGRESLFVYIVHLVIIYGSVINPKLNLRSQVGAILGFWEVMGWFFLFLAIMISAAKLWNYLKSRHTSYLRFGQIAAAIIFILIFVTQEH